MIVACDWFISVWNEAAGKIADGEKFSRLSGPHAPHVSQYSESFELSSLSRLSHTHTHLHRNAQGWNPDTPRNNYMVIQDFFLNDRLSSCVVLFDTATFQSHRRYVVPT